MEEGYDLVPITQEELAAFESLNLNQPLPILTPSLSSIPTPSPIRVSNAPAPPSFSSPSSQTRTIVKPSSSSSRPIITSPTIPMRPTIQTSTPSFSSSVVQEEKGKEKEKEYDEEINREIVTRRPMEIEQHKGGGRMEVSVTRGNRMTPYGPISSSPSFEILVSEERLNEIMDFLRRDVDPSNISYRPGPGNAQLAYIEGVIVEDIANELFTPFGWSHEVKSISVTTKPAKSGFESTCHCIVRVTVHVLGNVFKEDTGSGIVTGSQEGVCQENARKGAITDGLKRALKHFGRGLGGSLYHKPTIAKYKELKGKGGK